MTQDRHKPRPVTAYAMDVLTYLSTLPCPAEGIVTERGMPEKAIDRAIVYLRKEVGVPIVGSPRVALWLSKETMSMLYDLMDDYWESYPAKGLEMTKTSAKLWHLAMIRVVHGGRHVKVVS